MAARAGRLSVLAALLASLTACLHLPRDVAAVVDEPDPPATNHYQRHR